MSYIPQARLNLGFIDPNYIQHNPARIKQAEEDKLNDYQELRKAFIPAPRAQGATPRAAAGLQPHSAGTL